MKKTLEIINDAYKKQNEATEKLMEIYDYGKELTADQRNELLRVINDQKSAALGLHNIIYIMNK